MCVYSHLLWLMGSCRHCGASWAGGDLCLCIRTLCVCTGVCCGVCMCVSPTSVEEPHGYASHLALVGPALLSWDVAPGSPALSGLFADKSPKWGQQGRNTFGA